MAYQLRSTPLGRPALNLLAKELYKSQIEDVLNPVLVIVPSNLTGLTIRRLVSSGAFVEVAKQTEATNGVGRSFNGLANVHFDTPFEVALRLGGRSLVQMPTVALPGLEAAIRLALKDNPGSFANVKDSHRTHRALARVFHSLDSLDEQSLEAVAQCNGTENLEYELVQLYRQVRAILGNYVLESDIADAVKNNPELQQRLKQYSSVIWYLPEPLSPSLLQMVGTLIKKAESASVIYANTSINAVDNLTLDVLHNAGLKLDANTSETDGTEIAESNKVSEPLASHLAVASDADSEVRFAVREIVRLVSEGTPADRIGLYYTNKTPYSRLVKHHLDESGLAHNGMSTKTLAQSVTGRFILKALEMYEGDRGPEQVLALIACAPVRFGKQRVRNSNWERIVRYARITGDNPDWDEALTAHIDYVKRKDDEGERIPGVLWPVEDVESLKGFVTKLFRDIDAIGKAQTWTDRAQLINRFLGETLGSTSQRRIWPEPEQDHYEDIEKALAQLSELDYLELIDISRGGSTGEKRTAQTRVGFRVFLNAFKSSLDKDTGSESRFGHGISHGLLTRARAADFDAVFILGCVEGLAPRSQVVDPLLSERAKAATNGLLYGREKQRDQQQLVFTYALCSAPKGMRWLTMSLQDSGKGAVATPSRWVLPTASALAQRNIRAKDFIGSLPDGVIDITSPTKSLETTKHYTSLAERDTASMWGSYSQGADLYTHELSPLVADAYDLVSARNSSEFTEYDGNLGSVEIPKLHERVLSPTHLQSWVQCGFAYLFKNILGVRPLDDPDDSNRFSALDKGSIVHKILEELGLVAIDRQLQPNQSWDTLTAELNKICQQVFLDAEQRSITGRELLWEIHKNDLISALHSYLEADDVMRSANRRTLAGVEHQFGFDSEFELDIGLGEPLKFRGIIDRVDHVGGDDNSVVLVDYKTSKVDDYKAISQDNPCDSALRLQLGIYAEAIFAQLGATAVETRYAMLQDPNTPIGYTAGPKQRAHLKEVLAAIVKAIEAGVFFGEHPEPSPYGSSNYKLCRYCDYGLLHPSDLADYEKRKHNSAGLEPRRVVQALEMEESRV